jgi:hypothetical protein
MLAPGESANPGITNPEKHEEPGGRPMSPVLRTRPGYPGSPSGLIIAGRPDVPGFADSPGANMGCPPGSGGTNPAAGFPPSVPPGNFPA